MSSPEPGGDAERIHLEAQAAGESRIYQAGRDQHIHFTDGVRHVRRSSQAADADECPYPGLAAFDATQAEWFFGRDALTADLVARLSDSLTEGGPLMVVAPSGAGKSSLLQAGLRHAVMRGALPVAGSRDWPQIAFTPTAHPLRQAAAKIAEVAGSPGPANAAPDGAQLTELLGRTLQTRARPSQATPKAIVIVDQLEELFTLCASEAERRAFIDWLCGLAQPAGSGTPPALVICGLRADFYSDCANYPKLRQALGAGQIVASRTARGDYLPCADGRPRHRKRSGRVAAPRSRQYARR